ncbi:MAG: nicotinate dehydrogenase subunit [Nocardioidaceae bacterium]|nr:nicotinate dehydrogenase subunit [Nocardioidaceae bacterium]
MTIDPRPLVPAHIESNPLLGTWLAAGDGTVEVSVGKVELGQGILTALQQVAADALALPLDLVHIRSARTGGPDQGLTAGSLSVLQSTPALRHLGAVVRQLAEAPGNTSQDETAAYLDRIAGLDSSLDLTAFTPQVGPAPNRAVGADAPRVDLPEKVLGRPRFLADLRPEGLLHGRVLRPPSPAASLVGLPESWSSPGVVLVRDGSFVGVVGDREDDVDRALASLTGVAVWDERDTLPDEHDLPAWLRTTASEPTELMTEGDVEATRSASYSKPYLAHASIAPSCAMARWTSDDSLRVWSHSQGIHSLRDAIAAALSIDRSGVRVDHVENAGCYGHNAADDAAFDAVLLARAVPGRPVLLRWTRSDELAWGPLSPAMTATVSARLVGGLVTGWSYDVWSQGHTARPGYAGQPGLLASAHVGGGVALPPSDDPPAAAGHGSLRNAVPIYELGTRRITGHRVTDASLRTSAMRSLGAYLNVFAIESFMDELAADAGLDPVDFRLAHLTDARARAVLKLAARESGWGDPLPESTGRGIGFARYKEKGAWCAVVAEVAVETEVRVRRLTVAADIGLVVNPDGARNQLAGGAVQSTSWTTLERVRFDRRRITSSDWESYPILRFPAAPRVDVHLIDTDQPPVGAGEAAQGPTAAAIANAVQAALGIRVRDLPLTAQAIVRAIEAEENP